MTGGTQLIELGGLTFDVPRALIRVKLDNTGAAWVRVAGSIFRLRPNGKVEPIVDAALCERVIRLWDRSKPPQ